MNNDHINETEYGYLWRLYYESIARTNYFTKLSAKYKCYNFVLISAVALLSAIELAIIVFSNSLDWLIPIFGFACSLLGFYISSKKLTKYSALSTHAQIAWDKASTQYANLFYLGNEGKPIKAKIEQIQQPIEYIDMKAIEVLKTFDEKLMDQAEEEAHKYLESPAS